MGLASNFHVELASYNATVILCLNHDILPGSASVFSTGIYFCVLRDSFQVLQPWILRLLRPLKGHGKWRRLSRFDCGLAPQMVRCREESHTPGVRNRFNASLHYRHTQPLIQSCEKTAHCAPHNADTPLCHYKGYQPFRRPRCYLQVHFFLSQWVGTKCPCNSRPDSFLLCDAEQRRMHCLESGPG